MTPPEVWAQRAPDTRTDAAGWRVRIVPNKYPALTQAHERKAATGGFHRSQRAFGLHEVIIESPDHVTHMGALGADHFADVLRAYRARLRVLSEDARWQHLMIYKNQGERAGATLEHIHSQLTALPIIPPAALAEMSGARKHFTATGRCVYCEISRREIRSGERLVIDSPRFVALCPFASRFGFETWILPKTHEAVFAECSENDIIALGDTLRSVMLKLGALFDNPPFNSIIHSAVRRDDDALRNHWHIKILPQLTRAAGFEWGSGIHMNSVAPEEAARLLRDRAL